MGVLVGVGSNSVTVAVKSAFEVFVGVKVNTTPKVGVELGVGLVVNVVIVGDGVAVIVRSTVAVRVPVTGVPSVAVGEMVGETVWVSVTDCWSNSPSAKYELEKIR